MQYVLLDFGVLSLVSIWLTGAHIHQHHRALFQSVCMSAADKAADMVQSMLVTMRKIGIAGGEITGGILYPPGPSSC